MRGICTGVKQLDMNETLNLETKPPYLSFTTFRNFLESFIEGVIPEKIDKSLMIGQSGGNQTYLMNALLFLGLMDEEQKPTDKLRSLLESWSSEESSRRIWKELFECSYKNIIEGLDLERATPEQLKSRFQEFEYGGDTLRKCHLFFNNIAEAGGVKLGPFLKNVGRAPSGRPRKAKTKKALAQQVDEPIASPKQKDEFDSHDVSVLKLDAYGKRMLKVKGPVAITEAELERIKSWVAVHFFVVESAEDLPTEENNSQEH